MAKYIEIPSLNFIDGNGKEFELEERLVYQSDIWPELIVVPAGFITDLASIPRIFQSLIPKVGKHALAAIVHDYLVRLPDFDRKLADKIFLEAMKLLGVNPVRRRLMYWAVALMTLALGLKGEKQ
jgi:hypothetical protein